MLIVPIIEQRKILGFIVLGNKKSGRVFTNVEFMALKVLAYQVALIVQGVNFLESMRKQIEQKEAEKAANLENLIAGIAHNLKTPIMSSAGGVSIIQEVVENITNSNDIQTMKESAGEIKSWSYDIQESLEYMNDIINRVKSQMKDNSEGENEQCVVDQLIEKVESLMSHELKANNCSCEILNYVTDNVCVRANLNDLLQVLNVLISNAIDSYKRKGGKVILIISKENQRLRILVQDNGAGISKIVQEKLFKKMVTTKGKYGRGLGLYLLYPMVKGRLCGDLGFSSEVGKGSSFWIEVGVSE